MTEHTIIAIEERVIALEQELLTFRRQLREEVGEPFAFGSRENNCLGTLAVNLRSLLNMAESAVDAVEKARVKA